MTELEQAVANINMAKAMAAKSPTILGCLDRALANIAQAQWEEANAEDFRRIGHENAALIAAHE